MDLKRHHVLYAVLAICLIVALIVLLTPGVPELSYRPPQEASSTSSSATAAILPIRFETVTTPAAQERGLGGRPEIPENYAMLFVLPQDENPGFWMKDMLVSIDILWLSDAGTILGIEDSVSPGTYPQIFYPPRPVRYVLEMKAGEARRRGWSAGTHVPLPAPYALPNAD